MVDKVLGAYVLADLAFAATGGVLVGFSIIVKNTMNNAPVDGTEAVENLIYQEFPLTAGIVNGILVFVTFLLTIPAMITPTRGWLKLSYFFIVSSALFSVILGLYMWILTLRTKEDFSPIWDKQTTQIQDLMQTQFACCGYFNSTSPAFVTDSTCPSPAAAALMRGCAAPIASFVNVFVDDLFTGVFGMAGVDLALLLATACLLKDRKERARFRYIDAKVEGRGM
ncbi:tetraspanin [Coniella lustricola]|uniref:Tetraspanin n=1 Tax=Coniella lustricola TaxID=2025994 RepID=A0A2T3AE29_9PEZI|nr:tetraspanin [Coniella lustricola]